MKSVSDGVNESVSILLALADSLPPATMASRLSDQSPETIQEVLAALPREKALAIASHLSSPTSDSTLDTGSLLEDVGGTIAELVETAEGVVKESISVAGAIDFMVTSKNTTQFPYLFVVDADRKLAGIVSMRDLLLAKPGQYLSEIMVSDLFTFQAETSISEAVSTVLKRHHRTYPVVDETGVFIGVVPAWKLFERVASDISAQSGSMVGVSKTERVDTSLFESFKMRHPWLQVNLLTAFAAAFVVGIFEDTISQIVALAVFLPVLAGQSGNTGCQALAITLRGLTLGELEDFPVSKLLRKEMILGALNGFFVGLVAALAMFLYASMTDSGNPAMLALTILLAMVGACTGSGIFGVLVPLTLRKFGADPATASSIFLTTATDVIGMGLMLFLATSLVL